MSHENHVKYTLEQVAQFHQQLLRLHQAGLRVQLDDSPTSTGHLAERLDEFMASLAGQFNKSPNWQQCLADTTDLPKRYRIALQTWCKCNSSPEALAMLRAPAQQAAEGAIDLRFALLLPMLVLTLIYGASFYLLQVFVPRIEAIYLQVGEAPSLPVRWLLSIRETMPYWVPGLPLLILFLACLLFTGRLRLPRWLPVHWQSLRYSSASQLAQNIELQLRFVSVKSEGTIDEQFTKQWRGLLQSPMLQWALAKNVPSPPENTAGPNSDSFSATQQRSRRLQLAANLYATMHTIHAQRFRGWLILIACIVFGGGLTLLYGLALFAPLVQLLKDIVQ